MLLQGKGSLRSLVTAFTARHDQKVSGLVRAVFKWSGTTKSALLRTGVLVASVAVLALSSVLFAVPTQAATSSTLTFQARLLGASGNLVADGTYNMQFNLYSVSSGGTTLWTESRLNNATQGVTLKNGYFSVDLGSITSFPGTINWDQELWLGMTVRGTGSCVFGSCTPTDAEMTPRFKLTAVPYAFKAGTALAVASNNTNAASTNSNNVSITSGNAAGATSNSGNITIDAGTATQTAGTLLFGTANASALTIGRTGVTTTNSGSLTVTQVLTASSNLVVTTLGTADTSTYLCRNTSNQLATCSSTPLTSILTDNIADAFDLQEGTNNYININTTNSLEEISFGNTTTNPYYTFLGSGYTTFGGVVNVTDGTDIVSISPSAGSVTIDSTNQYALLVQETGTSTDILWVDANATGGFGLNVSGYITASGDITGNWLVAESGIGIGDGSSNYTDIISASQSGDYSVTIPALSGNTTFCLQTNNCGYVANSLTDNTADALDIQEGTNNYININTTNSSENISFGNTTTNPTFSFLGSGTLTLNSSLSVVGEDITSTGDLTVTTSGTLYLATPTYVTGRLTQYLQTAQNAEWGIEASVDVFDPTTTPADYYGTNSSVTLTSNANAQDFSATEATGVYGFAANLGTALSVGNLRGVSGQVGINGSGSSITNASALYALSPVVTSGSITNNYGLYVQNQSQGTNDYGIYVAGADTYALFVDAGITRLDGNLEVDTDTIYADATNNHVSVGTTSNLNAKFAVVGTADEEQLLIRANGTQSTTNPLILAQTSAGAELFRITAPDEYTTYLGYRTGNADAGGGQNTGIGSSALWQNTTGYYNVAVGSQALSANVGGAANIAIGQQALATNASGGQNTAVGGSALQNSTGNYNSAFGFNAGLNTTGAQNLFLGYKAGDNLTTGSYNIIIGNEIDAISTTSDYQLNIGNILFGTTINGTGTTLSTGNLGVGTTAPGARLEVNSQTGGSQIGFIVDNTTSTGSIFVAKDNSTAVFTIADGGAVTATSSLTVQGATTLGDASSDTITLNGYIGSSILPSTNDTYDLGSDTLRWRDIYLGGETLHIGTSTSDEAALGYTTSTNTFTLQSTGGISLTSGAGTDLVNVLTGNLKVGNGTPGVALNGEDIYVEGTLEVDGAQQFDGALVATSTATFNGNLTVGDAVGDTVTVNSGAWTFANDTTIALSGGVNGLNIDSNTLSIDASNNRVGIGTASPDASLDVEATNGTELIRLSNSTTADSSGIFSGSGSPEGVVTAQIGSLYTDTTYGKVYKKSTGDGTNTGWSEFAAGTSADMAKMSRAAAQSIPSSAATKIAFDTEEYDVGGIADPVTNDRFNILKPGKYLITANYYISNALDDGEGMDIRIYKNGTQIKVATKFSSNINQWYSVEVSDVFDLTTGDYIELYVDHFEGAAVSTDTSVDLRPSMSVTQLDASGGGNPEVGARAYNSGAQSISNNTTTAVTFDSESYDTSGIHSTSSNTSRLTAPTAGKYLISGNACFDANAAGVRLFHVYVNGFMVASDRPTSIGAIFGTCGSVNTVYSMNAGDYAELYVFQNSGGSLNTSIGTAYSPALSLTKIDGGTSSTLQAAYNSGNTITTTDARDLLFTLADTTTDSNFTINLAGAGDFAIQDAGTQAFLVNDSGVVWVGSGGTATTATGNGDLYVQDAAEIDGNLVVGDANTDSAIFNANLLANNTTTGTTGTTSGAGNTNTTTITLSAAGSFANNDIIFVDNTGGSGQDYYTRITSGGGTTTLTVSPAVSYGTNAGYTGNATITKYTAQNIGATSTDYTTQTNRFFQGYFLGGVVTGAGSTTLSDGILNSTTGLALQTSGTTRLGVNGSGVTTLSGTTTAPLVVDTTQTASYINFKTSGTSRGYVGYSVSGTGGLAFVNAAGSTVNLLMTDAGNLGIGTTSPAFQTNYGGLQVNTASGGTVVRLTNTTTGTTNADGFDLIVGNGSSDAYIWQREAANLYIGTSATEALRVDSSGNIGIGGIASAFNGVQIHDTTATNTYLHLSNSFTGSTTTDGYSLAVGSDATAFLIQRENASFILRVNGTDRLTVTGAGATTISGALTVSTSLTVAAVDSSIQYTTLDGLRISGEDTANAIYGGARYVSITADSGYGVQLCPVSACSTSGLTVYTDTGNVDIKNSILNSSSNHSGRVYIADSLETQYYINYADGTANTNTNVCKNSFGSLAACSSAIRHKENINTLTLGLNELRQLNPVTYQWKSTGKNDVGFIAEQVAAILPDSVTYNSEGLVESFNPVTVTSLLTKASQQLDVQVQLMDARLAVIESGVFSGSLSVANNINVGNELRVTGNTTLSANLIVQGNTTVQKLTVNGKIISSGTAPTLALGQALTGIVGAAATGDGTDTAGTVTVNSGTQASAAGEIAEVTFTSAYGTAPKVVLSGNTAVSAKLGAYIVRTTTGFKIVTDDPLQTGQTYSFDYIIIEARN